MQVDLGKQVDLNGPTGTVGLNASTYRGNSPASPFYIGQGSACTIELTLTLGVGTVSTALKVKLQMQSRDDSTVWSDIQTTRQDNGNTSNEQSFSAADIAALKTFCLQTSSGFGSVNAMRLVAVGDGTHATVAGDRVIGYVSVSN